MAVEKGNQTRADAAGASERAPTGAAAARTGSAATPSKVGGGKAGQIVASGKPRRGSWTERLVRFLRVMAGVSMMKGLFHWAIVCGFIGAPDGFLAEPLAWRVATVFFAVIDLIAAVGLWLAAAWGAVVWLTASVSMVVVNVFFPQVYGDQIAIIVVELVLIGLYLFLAIQAARAQPR